MACAVPATVKAVTDMMQASKDVFGDAARTKSSSMVNAFVKETTTSKRACAELAQLLLTSTLSLNHAKATSFVGMKNSWWMATVNARLVLTESTVSVLGALPMPILTLSPKAADATKGSNWSMESAQLAPTTNISHTRPTDVNASSHSTGSMELAKLANPDGSTMLKLNAATKKTLAILLKP
jgi:hypothetical protein